MLCGLVLLLAPRAVHASHALGSDMYYVNVAPGVYQVTYRLYRDCSGIPAPWSFTLTYTGTGCGTSGTSTNSGGTFTLRRDNYYDANPYCPAVNAQSVCDTANPVMSPYPNFQIHSYTGLLTLGNAPYQQCREWMLLGIESARPEVANIDLNSSSNLASFLKLNNRDTNTDTSPVFSIMDGLQPLAFMCPHTAIRYNAGVLDSDGDSLVYSLAPAYDDTPGSGTTGQAVYAAAYSPTMPLRCDPSPTGGPAVELDPRTGTLTFIAGDYVANTANDKANKFVVVIQVDAFRRVQGQVIKTATIRRDLAVVIVNHCPTVAVPPPTLSHITALSPGRAPVYYSANDVVQGYLNEPLTLQFNFVGGSLLDSLFVSVDPSSVPAGGNFTPASSIGTAQASLQWTPTAQSWQPQAMYLGARGIACPVALKACYPIQISVAAPRPAGLPADLKAQRPAATPNPFTSEAQLTLAPSASVRELLITDAVGRLVDRLPVAAGQRTLLWRPASTLPLGLYYARCAGEPAVALRRE